MSQEELRIVEFLVTEKGRTKKGKKPSKKEVRKLGFFHVWATTGKGTKKFTGLVEDAETGLLIEIGYKNIRFLSEAELDALTDAAIEEAEALIIADDIVAEAETASETAEQETPDAENTAEEPAAAKPRRTKKA
ncbi:hypothetical protein ACLI1A_03450 [Flavobacterium sp. RHBU_3]|uniref:hypothetical protein n=1 Tax=Flavobacterium sp. RHBU_3 TaxID=3391184 RepID=UPI003984DCBD